MNPFLAALEAAAEARRTHHQREAEQTRAHFARHPECRKIISAMDREGQVTRVKGEIDIEARCQPGWFKPAMWKGNRYKADRPVEQQGTQPEAVYLSFSLRSGQASNEIALRGHRKGDAEDVPLLTQSGRAVNANEFMKRYLSALRDKQSAPPVISSLHRPTLKPMKINRAPSIRGFAPVI
jgi:hypothetical protein